MYNIKSKYVQIKLEVKLVSLVIVFYVNKAVKEYITLINNFVIDSLIVVMNLHSKIIRSISLKIRLVLENIKSIPI